MRPYSIRAFHGSCGRLQKDLAAASFCSCNHASRVITKVVNMSTSTGYQDRARHTELKVHLIRLGQSQQVLARALGIPANLISHPPPPVKPNKKRAA